MKTIYSGILIIILILCSCSQSKPFKKINGIFFKVDSIELFSGMSKEYNNYGLIHLSIFNDRDIKFVFINKNNIMFKVPYTSGVFLKDINKEYPLYSTLKHQNTIIDPFSHKKIVLILDSVFFKDKLRKEPKYDVRKIEEEIRKCMIFYRRDKNDTIEGVEQDTLYKIKITKKVTFLSRVHL